MTLSYPNKLLSFDPSTSYRSRALSELNNLCYEINDSKFKLRNSLQYYLRKYRELLDIPRLCRALAVPGELAEQFIEASDKPKEYLDGLDKVSQITNQISTILNDYLKDISSTAGLAKTQLTTRQKEAIYNDINELFVYLKMYYDIESVRLDLLLSDEYPCGNPFDHIVDIMIRGAIITRFKYVSRDGFLPPHERVVSYHILDYSSPSRNEQVLAVHVEGDKKFSMYKKWGDGDEKLRPFYPEYRDTVIRWGKDEAQDVVLHRGKRYGAEEFLY
jgi:hypothetical protein